MLGAHTGVRAADRTLEMAPKILDAVDARAVLRGILASVVIDLDVAVTLLVDVLVPAHLVRADDRAGNHVPLDQGVHRDLGAGGDDAGHNLAAGTLDAAATPNRPSAMIAFTIYSLPHTLPEAPSYERKNPIDMLEIRTQWEHPQRGWGYASSRTAGSSMRNGLPPLRSLMCRETDHAQLVASGGGAPSPGSAGGRSNGAASLA